ncbi:MAG: recombinase family protein [Deferribacteraceae bacterium]|jgi:DNA invertase Pin-like site-specific DNA recombinase|nr:recombinase family protein [Deferribacteraceae bacterium]
MIYAYIRVSTDKQDFNNQRYSVLEYTDRHNLSDINFISESVSGRKNWKERAIAEIVDNAVDGDVLIVSELSRLGRSMLEIFELISILLRKNIQIHVIKGNTVLKDDIPSKVFTFAFSLGSEIERDLISQRTKEALAAKKANGQKLGRKKGSQSCKLDIRLEEIKSFIDKNTSVSSIAKLLNIPRSTMYYFCKTRKLLSV